MERFGSRFGDDHLLLACHAALPLVLTPELLNFLRTRFLLKQVPWIAEADLLLSDLCREIGRDLYAIELPTRNYLLGEMEIRFGHERMEEVANVLLSYVHRVAQEDGTFPPEELQAERWAAMSYIDSTRDEVIDELVTAFWKCLIFQDDGTVKEINWSEMARLLIIIEEITPQIYEYSELIKYAELTGRIIADHSGEETLEMLRANLLAEELFVNGRSLPRLDTLVSKKRYETVAAAAIVHNASWKLIEESFFNHTPVKGQVVGNNKGGLLVDVGGILTFLPGRQVDVHPISNLSAFRNQDIEALVIEANLEEGQVVLSRRAFLEETERAAFDKEIQHLEEGMIVEGHIVGIFEHGAFVNFGLEVDGLLHISEMSWGFVPNLDRLFKTGDPVEALVIKLDREARSILLSCKQLVPNPWLTVEEKYSRGMKVKGTVLSITDLRGGDERTRHSGERVWTYVELEPHVVARVGLWEFAKPGDEESAELPPLPKEGDEIELWVVDIRAERARMTLSTNERLDEESAFDLSMASAWDELENAFNENLTIHGTVVQRAKGGLMVDLNGILAFLPGSHIDIRPVRNLDAWVKRPIEGKITRLNRKRANVLFSRKLALEEENARKRNQTLQQIEEGIVVEGQIKNLTDYGAFVDLGGVDGLLHLTDMSWGRLQDPNELFRVGDNIQVKVLKFDPERERISLGYKQLQPDPWSTVEERFPVGTRVTGKVVSVADYGAFVELASGVEGLVHVSEMTWSKRVKHPSKVVISGDKVEVEVLSVDPSVRRISLGMKQVQDNPWQTVHERYQVGNRVHGRVRNLTKFGAFIEIEDGVDGLVHVSDISWSRRLKHPSESLKKGQEVDAVITSIDTDKRWLSLSIKDANPNPAESFIDKHEPGDIVRGRVSRFANFGVFVELADNLEGLCHSSELSEEQEAKPEDVVQLGQEMDFRILRMDPDSKKIGLSVIAVGKEWDPSALEDETGEPSGS